MFGYVLPCKMELKVKDHEKFKSYYCGLCISIKKQFGNLPRMALNYDMTFLAVLLDGLSAEKDLYKIIRCIAHPTKKKIIIEKNTSIDFAAYCNIMLSYYKLLDDAADDKKISKKLASSILKTYINKDDTNKALEEYIKNRLYDLSKLENNPPEDISLDSISDPFALLTGYLLSFSIEDLILKYKLHTLGYNIGKWIYLIDAYDDLEKDMEKNKFNAINTIFNKEHLSFEEFLPSIKDRIEFTLTCCASTALQSLKKLPLIKNKNLLYNIIELGLMEKMEIIFKRSENHERSL